MLPIRPCGSQGFKCAAQGLGCMSMSAAYGDFASPEAEAESLRVLNRAADIEGLMLDTSDVYGPFTNEQLIGKALAEKRGDLKIATKFGFQINPDAPGGFELSSTKDYVKQACQASLDRLGVDCIDLYYLHRHDFKTPIEETMQGLKELVEEGKIKYVGVSEIGIATLRKAHACYPITAYQLEWSIFAREPEAELVPTCRELGIGLVPYSPLGRGFLTGTVKSMDDIPEGDFRHNVPRIVEYFDQNMKLVEVIKEVAAEKECTPGQVALAWLHAQGEDVFPIPGTKKVHRFEENIGAFNVKLTTEDMEKLDQIADQIKGDRYNADFAPLTFEGHGAMGF